ncbi:hypothetical protein ACKWRH_33195 [Bradyrhizobium sp. Pa8]|uniref:hypothetical protein n=1 Tax=Bradyrhizobium sp. Pa8 TaxID=3386552 RepID=UPI00403F4E91
MNEISGSAPPRFATDRGGEAELIAAEAQLCPFPSAKGSRTVTSTATRNGGDRGASDETPSNWFGVFPPSWILGSCGPRRDRSCLRALAQALKRDVEHRHHKNPD